MHARDAAIDGAKEQKEIEGRCKVIFESDTGWIFLEARTGISVTLKNNFTTALFAVVLG